jgi:hypothetical protein
MTPSTAATASPTDLGDATIDVTYFRSPSVVSMAMSHGPTVAATPAFAMLEWFRPAPPVNVEVLVVRPP